MQHIKALNLQGIFYRRILGVQKDFFDATMQYQRFSILTSLLMSGMGLIVSYACLGWAAYRMWIGAISFGTMVLFLQVSSYLSSAFSALVGLVPSAISATVSARRLMSVLELPREDEAEAEAAQRLCGQPLTLVLDELQFSYQNGTPILQSLSLTVHPGERIAFVGRSGSGKTTLFRVMLGLLHPQQGRAVVQCGERELKLSASTRCLFAYVPQDCLMFSGTIAESLRLVRPDATDEALWNVLETACAAEFVRKQYTARTRQQPVRWAGAATGSCTSAADRGSDFAAGRGDCGAGFGNRTSGACQYLSSLCRSDFANRNPQTQCAGAV